MKLSWSLALVGASWVAAQSIDEYFPACSVDCLTESVPLATDCTAEDAVCICVFENYDAIVTHSTSCVIKECGADVAVDEVLPAAAEYCIAATAAAASSAAGPTETGATATESDSPEATGEDADDQEADDEEAAPEETPGAAAGRSVPLMGVLGLGALALL